MVRVRALWHTVFVRECVCARVYERVCVVFFGAGGCRIVVRCLCDVAYCGCEREGVCKSV